MDYDDDDGTSIFVLITIFILTVSIIGFIGYYITNKAKLLLYIKSLSIDYNNIKYAIGTLEDNVETIGNTIHHVINDVEKTIKNVETVIDNVKQDVTTVVADVDKLVTPLVTTVNSVNDKINQLKSTIANC